MKPYELTYIISSEIPSDQADNLKKEVENFIQDKEGVILKSEKTIVRTLAYPIKKQSSGYFVILTFQILEDKIKEINEKLKKEVKILRHFIIVKKPAKQMKERRTRKPPVMTEPEPKGVEMLTEKDKHKGEKIELDDIEKRLDEILSE